MAPSRALSSRQQTLYGHQNKKADTVTNSIEEQKKLTLIGAFVLHHFPEIFGALWTPARPAPIRTKCNWFVGYVFEADCQLLENGVIADWQ